MSGPLRPLGSSGVRLTALGFGGAPLGNLFDPVPPDVARATVRAAWDAGVRYFDTAPLYGHGLSERRLGDALRGEPRDSFVLSTKVGRLLVPAPEGPAPGSAYVDVPPLRVEFDYSAEAARRSLLSSLERLRLSRIDIAYVHDIDGFTHGEHQPARCREALAGALPALARLKAEGVIRALGLGVNEWEVCQQVAGEVDLDGVLLAGRYSLLEQGALDTFLPLCERRGIGVVIGGPFNSGILVTGPVPGARYNYRPAPPPILNRVRALERVCQAHGVPLAAAALQFPLAHPAVVSVIPGARAPEEVAQQQALALTPIPAALWRDLKAERLLHPAAPTPA